MGKVGDAVGTFWSGLTGGPKTTTTTTTTTPVPTSGNKGLIIAGVILGLAALFGIGYAIYRASASKKGKEKTE